jgi:hypothetical protein
MTTGLEPCKNLGLGLTEQGKGKSSRFFSCRMLARTGENVPAAQRTERLRKRKGERISAGSAACGGRGGGWV